MREILFPAHRLLHLNTSTAQKPNSLAQPLTVPSELYDTLRATLVQAELILLRVLGFELRSPLPLDYVARYLERAISHLTNAEDEYDDWGKEAKEEYGVVKECVDTRLGRACRAQAVTACKNYQLANLYPARAVALGCVFVVMEDRGLATVRDKREWTNAICGRKVDFDDFEEVIDLLKSEA
ncbi:hypothetical protein ACLMJK_005323 [Lecanora helva]